LIEKFQEEQYVSKARRRATRVIVHQSVEARQNQRFNFRSKSQESIKSSAYTPINLINLSKGSNTKDVSEGSSALEKRFNELLAKQTSLLEKHRGQFEGVMRSDVDTSFLPGHIRTLLSDGL